MPLDRTPLLLERTRPSVTGIPKSRTRQISSRKMIGGARRSLYARIERRFRDKATPQAREVMRGTAKIREVRRKNDRPSLPGRPSVKSQLMRGARL